MSKNKTKYNLLEYKPTAHFLERINERFGVQPHELNQFLKEHQNSNFTEIPNEEKRVNACSNRGIMFVLDTESKTLVTAFDVVNPSIADSHKEAFDERLTELVKETNARLAKDMLLAMDERIDRFNANVAFIRAHESNDIDSEMIDTIFDDVQTIRTTLRVYNTHKKYFEQHLSHLKHASDTQETHSDAQTTHTVQAVTRGGVGEHAIGTMVMEDLKPQSKQELNRWATKVLGTTMTKTLFKIIRTGVNRDQLLSKMKAQLTIITFRKFEIFIDELIAKDIKGGV